MNQTENMHYHKMTTVSATAVGVTTIKYYWELLTIIYIKFTINP